MEPTAKITVLGFYSEHRSVVELKLEELAPSCSHLERCTQEHGLEKEGFTESMSDITRPLTFAVTCPFPSRMEVEAPMPPVRVKRVHRMSTGGIVSSMFRTIWILRERAHQTQVRMTSVPTPNPSTTRKK